jgi:hypothetical protein
LLCFSPEFELKLPLLEALSRNLETALFKKSFLPSLDIKNTTPKGNHNHKNKAVIIQDITSLSFLLLFLPLSFY